MGSPSKKKKVENESSDEEGRESGGTYSGTDDNPSIFNDSDEQDMEDEDEEQVATTSADILFDPENSSIPDPKDDLGVSDSKGPIPPGKILELLDYLKKRKEFLNLPISTMSERYLRLKSDDGKLYKAALVKKELLRYYKMAVLSEMVTVDDVATITKMFLRTGKAIKMYPDYPNAEPPTSHHQLFMKLERPKVAEEHPGWGFGQIIKELSERWRNLHIDKRLELEQKYEDLVDNYHKEMLAFFERNPDLKAAGKAFEAQVNGRVPPPPVSKLPKKPEPKFKVKAKPIITGFQMYCRAKGSRYAEKYELEEDSEQLIGKMRKKYDKLSESKKSEYEDLAREENRKESGNSGPSESAELEEPEEIALKILKSDLHSRGKATHGELKNRTKKAKELEAMELTKAKERVAESNGSASMEHLMSTPKAQETESEVDVGGSPKRSKPMSAKKRKKKERQEAEKKARLEAQHVEKTLEALGIE